MKSIKANLVSPVPTKTLPPARAKTPKLTPWFKRNTKPARAGVYQRLMPGTGAVKYGYWNGRRWGWSCDGGAREAYEARSIPSAIAEGARWRGLASNPASNKGEHA